MGEAVRKVARKARHAALASLRAVGGFRWIAASTWRRGRLLILCYHGVSLQDEHEWDPELLVTRAFLRRRFEIVRDSGCVVLPLGEGVFPTRRASTSQRSPHNFFAAAAAAPLL